MKIKEGKDKTDKKKDKVYLFEQDQSITPLVIILLIPITFSHDHGYCKEKVGATSVGERKKKKSYFPRLTTVSRLCRESVDFTT